jgi:SAM-dependent methyltransferase
VGGEEIMIVPKASDWTEDSISRMWDWHNSNSFSKRMYFSLMEGRAITNLLAATGMLHGNILDFGCGKGDLLTLLLEHPTFCYGVEHSEGSVAYVNQRFINHPNWQGATLIENNRTEYQDNFFNLIMLIETLEHISEERSLPLLIELKRILKPDGIIVVTTPFNENLDEEQVYCPFCETVFHRWQHLRNFSIESMKEQVSAGGLHSDFCKNLDFDQFQSSPSFLPLKYLSFSKTYQWLRFKKCQLIDFVVRRDFLKSQQFRYRAAMGNKRHLCAFLTKNKSE